MLLMSSANSLFDTDRLSAPLTYLVVSIVFMELSLQYNCGANLPSDTLQNKTVRNFQRNPNGSYLSHLHCKDSTSIEALQEVYHL